MSPHQTARVLAIPVVAVMVLEIAACIALRRGVMRSGAVTIANVRWALSPNPYRAGEILVTAVVAATPIATVVGHFLVGAWCTSRWRRGLPPPIWVVLLWGVSVFAVLPTLWFLWVAGDNGSSLPY